MTLKISTVPGFKKDGDKILIIKCMDCNTHNAPSYEEIAEMMIELCNIEEHLFPSREGYRGAQMFIDYINEAMTTRTVPDRNKYGFKK